MEEFDIGEIDPSKDKQWGAFDPCGVYTPGLRWFRHRANAVTYAREHFGTQYAIARAWGFE